MQEQDIVWNANNAKASKMWQFLEYVNNETQAQYQSYAELHHWSITEPAQFWSFLASFLKIDFKTAAQSILKQGAHMWEARWFEGASFNFAEQLLKGPDDKLAIVGINEANKRETWSYRALREAVAQCQEGLLSLGIKPGARVVAIMPNVAQTIIAMLATTSIGAIWASCSPDFGADAALDRLGQLEPELLFICNGQQYNGKSHSAKDKIISIQKALPSLKRIVIYDLIDAPNLEDMPLSTRFEAFGKKGCPIQFQAFAFEQPLYILFSSGTTGKPKCIVHGAGATLLQHLKELALHTNLSATDTLFFYTTCGWMMWNWTVSALALGTTIVLYEGAALYPSPLRLFDIIEHESVTVFGTSAKYLASIEKSGLIPKEHYTLNTLKTILSTGSPLLATQYDDVYQHIKKDLALCSISGGTDIISCFALGNPLLPIHKGELQCFGLGMDGAIFNEDGKAVRLERGELVCRSPFPSMPLYFWNDPEQKAYQKAYFSRFENIWAHGDFAEQTAHDGLVIYGRSDAILNPGGVRIGTAEIYRQIERIPEILDSVVIGQPWADDVRVVLFVTLREGMLLNETLKTQIRTTLRNNASPRHVPAIIIQVADIPKTINGKTVEIAVRQAVQNEPIQNLNSLANPKALNYFRNLAALNSDEAN